MARGKRVGPGTFLKRSPHKFIGAVAGVVGGVANLIGGNKAAAAAEAQQKKARAEMRRQKSAYEALDTSNIYANVENQFTNMENVYEDMTINQQQAQFEAQQGAQQRADIMQDLRGAAGGSGIAALAQQMATQGQLATQRASASIGQQEAQAQKLKLGEAGRLQQLERTGEAQAEAQRLAGAESARGLEYEKRQGLMGLASGELQAANQAVAQAEAQQSAGISGIIGGGLSGLGSLASGGAFDKLIPGASDFMKKYS